MKRDEFERWLQRMIVEKRRQEKPKEVDRYLDMLLEIDTTMEFLEIVA